MCGLLQLSGAVDHDEIYLDYLYQSSVTSGLAGFYSKLASDLFRGLGLASGDLVVDIGSNDGSGLMPFVDQGARVVGVEPAAAPAARSQERGIFTVNDFLTAAVGDAISTEHGPARLVSANYVFANVAAPAEFLSCMRNLLAPDGVVSIVTGYHPDQFAVGMFEYVNHDHLSYFDARSMNSLAQQCGMRLLSANRVEHKGGSIHFVLANSESAARPDGTVPKLMQREAWMDADGRIAILSLRKRLARLQRDLHEVLGVFTPGDIAGIGASISTTHLLHEFELGDRLAVLFDDDPRKFGRFSPGFGLEVRPLSELVGTGIGWLVMLAWQHTNVLMDRLRDSGFQGSVAVPIPEVRIVMVK